ncbi:MAG: ubiquinol-cytochrome c reductase iron-sulfur subunit [Myxococcota bacterium]
MGKVDRRETMHRLAWGLVATSSGTAAAASTALFFPRVRYREPSEVVVGNPGDYRIGEVSERASRNQRFAVIRDERGLYVVSSVCTHLGCIARWQPSQGQFKCFCHGSGFRRDGVPFEGPASRPLERLKVRYDREGRVVVDTAVRFRGERGEWEREGAWLPFIRE